VRQWFWADTRQQKKPSGVSLATFMALLLGNGRECRCVHDGIVFPVTFVGFWINALHPGLLFVLRRFRTGRRHHSRGDRIMADCVLPLLSTDRTG